MKKTPPSAAASSAKGQQAAPAKCAKAPVEQVQQASRARDLPKVSPNKGSSKEKKSQPASGKPTPAAAAKKPSPKPSPAPWATVNRSQSSVVSADASLWPSLGQVTTTATPSQKVSKVEANGTAASASLTRPKEQVKDNQQERQVRPAQVKKKTCYVPFDVSPFSSEDNVHAFLKAHRHSVLSKGNNLTYHGAVIAAIGHFEVCKFEDLGLGSPVNHSLLGKWYRREKDVTAFITCFVSVRVISTLHDLEKDLLAYKKVESLKKLGITTLLKNETVIRYFLPPKSVQSVPHISTFDVVACLWRYNEMIGRCERVNLNEACTHLSLK